MLYKEWVDIVIFNDCDRVQTREQRLDVSHALDLSFIKTSRDMLAWSNTKEQDANLREFGHRLTLDAVVFDPDDVFEAMQITDLGQVTIWTQKYVGTIHHLLGTIEKLGLLPRNPPQL